MAVTELTTEQMFWLDHMMEHQEDLKFKEDTEKQYDALDYGKCMCGKTGRLGTPCLRQSPDGGGLEECGEYV
jgi:hypothetical protein